MARWCIGKHSSCRLQGGVVTVVVGSNPAGGRYMDVFTLVLKYLHWCISVYHNINKNFTVVKLDLVTYLQYQKSAY